MNDINDKKTITILTALLGKKVLTDEETKAVRDAIGILSWTSLIESRIKNKRAKRAEDAEKEQ